MNRTWILGLDASTPRCVVSLGYVTDDGLDALVAFDDELDQANQASLRLSGRLDGVLREAGIAASELGLIGSGRGPGTFTGTRVALATAKGLALGLQCPLLPVSTLAALAFSASEVGSTCNVLSTLDARRGEVYGALLRCAGAPEQRMEWLLEETACPMDDLVASVHALGLRPDAVIGPGAHAYREAVPSSWPSVVEVAGPSPQGLWRALVAGYGARETCDPAHAEALYLRQSYAELGLNRPKRPFVKSPFV